MEGYNYEAYPPTFLQPAPEQDLSLYPPESAYAEYYDLAHLYNEDYYGPSNKERPRSYHKPGSHHSSRSSARSTSSSSSSATHTTATSDVPPDLLNHTFRQPSFLDAFRVLYLNDNSDGKKSSQYLVTKKKQDHIEEVLERDGLGSKKWLLYPRSRGHSDLIVSESRSSANNDRRVKVDGEFMRKYSRQKLNKNDAPIAKLKRWELMLYKKLGFIQNV